MFLKTTKKRVINTLVIGIALPLIVVSCGGGDGGAPAAPVAGVPTLSTATIPTQQLTIDSTNSVSVAGNVRNVLPTFSDFSGAPSANISGVELSTSPKKSIVNLTNRIFSQLKDSQIDSSVSGVLVPTCESGSKSEPTNIPTTGSFNGSYTFSYSNCRVGNATIDGSFTIAGTVTLDSNNYLTNLNLTATFNNLTISDVGFIASIDGGFTIKYSDVVGTESFSFSGTRLTFRDDQNAFEIKDFLIATTKDTTLETFEANYTISSTLIGGFLTVSTSVKFEQTIVKLYPYIGQIEVIGAANTKVKLTVDSGGVGDPTDTVTLEIDPDGLGYDSTLTQTLMWSQL